MIFAQTNDSTNDDATFRQSSTTDPRGNSVIKRSMLFVAGSVKLSLERLIQLSKTQITREKAREERFACVTATDASNVNNSSRVEGSE